ncbi:MAG: DUF2851 family protein [Ferruginibacter sp.]
MTERLLQFIWQFGHYNSGGLQTTESQALQIIHPGIYNTNQGPDFLNAKVKIGETLWVGSIEIHLNSTDWNVHQHSIDTNYNNVILHVVFNHNQDIGLPFPTLELQQRVSKVLLNRYQSLMQANYFIPCENHISHIPSITITAWKESLMAERLQQKAEYIQQLLQKNNHHWEETFWWLLAKNFGLKINSDAFEKIAQSIPINILAKHKNQLIQLEALLLGQGGLLNEQFEESYPAMLQKEYGFLQKKYGLQKVHLPLYFLRMRPANFPTVRLAQLASLVSGSQHLFSKIKEAENIAEVQLLLAVTANDYWHYHYVLDVPADFKKKSLGKGMIQNILINTVIPILYAYGYYNKTETFKNKALLWLEQIAPEHNSITKGFQLLGIQNKNAFDSQAFIQLKNQYCNHMYCLQCAIGSKILKEV